MFSSWFPYPSWHKNKLVTIEGNFCYNTSDLVLPSEAIKWFLKVVLLKACKLNYNLVLLLTVGEKEYWQRLKCPLTKSMIKTWFYRMGLSKFSYLLKFGFLFLCEAEEACAQLVDEAETIAQYTACICISVFRTLPNY